MLQLPQRLRFNLPDPLPRHRELLPDLFQRVIGVHPDAEPHPQHPFFTRRQGCQHPRRRFAQVRLDGGIDRQDGVLVFDEVAQVRILLETPVGDEEDSHLGDFIQDHNAIIPVDAAIQANLKETVTRVLASLTPREERVLRMRFGIGITPITRSRKSASSSR